MSSSLGQKIHRLRKEKGMTLEELGELTDSSKSYIWELENKNPPRPSAGKIARIAHELDVKIEYLLDDEGNISEEESVDAQVLQGIPENGSRNPKENPVHGKTDRKK